MSEVCELIIGRGQDIKSAIEAFILEKGWDNVYISGAIGSVCEARFTAPCQRRLPSSGGGQ